jgi:hypothetical protein
LIIFGNHIFNHDLGIILIIKLVGIKALVIVVEFTVIKKSDRDISESVSLAYFTAAHNFCLLPDSPV